MAVENTAFFIGELMTVQVTDRLSQLYVGNGVNTRFDFTFRVFDQEYETGVAVRIKVGNEFEFLDETKYTVTINPDNLGGYVNFLDAPDAQTYFYIAGKTPVDQLLDITNYDNFYPDAIERALDKLTAILQEWKHLVDFESQARILADTDYDELARIREESLKAYIDGIASAITGKPVLGLPAEYVVDGDETQKAINTQAQYSVSTFSDLRALKYKASKHKKGVFVCQRSDDYKFGGGLFVPDLTDTTTADDDGTILVGLNGVRWKRKWNAHADPCWFGADYKGLVDCSPQVQKAIDVSYGRVWFGNAERNFKMMTPVGLPTNSIVGDMLMEICGAGARIWVYSDTGIFTSKRSIGYETSNSDLYTAVIEFGRGLRFQGDGTSPSVVINGDRLYNVNMKGGRYLRNTALVKATIPRRSENTGYLQSVTIEGNHLALCRKIIDSKRGFNINFNRNFGESCYGGLYIDGEGAPAVNVVHCEGNLWESGGVFAKLGATYAGTFIGNYFEGNTAGDVPILKCMIELGKTGSTQYSSGVTFIGNQFGASAIYKTDPDYCDVKFLSALSGTGLDNLTPPVFIGNWTNGYRMWSEGQVLTQFGNTFSGGSARRHGAPKLHTEARVTFDLSRKDFVSSTSLTGGVHVICELETSMLEAITAQANRACSADLNIFMQMKTSNNIVLGSALAKVSLLAQGAEGISVGAVNSVYVGATLTGFVQMDGGLIDNVNNISLFKHFTNPVLTLQRVGTKYQLKLSGYAPLTGTIYGDTVKISSNSIMTIYSLNSGGSLSGQISFS